MKSLIIRFLRDEEGQTSTEYILLVAVAALLVLRFKSVATEKLGALTEGVFGTSQQKILQDLNSAP